MAQFAVKSDRIVCSLHGGGEFERLSAQTAVKLPTVAF